MVNTRVHVNCPQFHWDTKDRYHEWQDFALDVDNIFRGTYSSVDKKERSALVLNWMGHEAVKIINSLDTEKKKQVRGDVDQLAKYFEDRFKPEANTILASFQFRQLKRGKKSTDDFMSELRSKAAECAYVDIDRQVREQFTVNIDDNKMQNELLSKLTDKSTPDQALKIVCKIEAQRAQKSAITESKEFNAVGTQGRGRGHGGRGCG